MTFLIQRKQTISIDWDQFKFSWQLHMQMKSSSDFCRAQWKPFSGVITVTVDQHLQGYILMVLLEQAWCDTIFHYLPNWYIMWEGKVTELWILHLLPWIQGDRRSWAYPFWLTFWLASNILGDVDDVLRKKAAKKDFLTWSSRRTPWEERQKVAKNDQKVELYSNAIDYWPIFWLRMLKCSFFFFLRMQNF